MTGQPENNFLRKMWEHQGYSFFREIGGLLFLVILMAMVAFMFYVSSVVGSFKADAAIHGMHGDRYGGVVHSSKKVYTIKKEKVYTTKKSASKSVYKAPSVTGGQSKYVLNGKASYYWQPQAVASGGRFNPNALTAAHKTLPFGTKVRVTNKNNGKSVVVTINDRGPYIKGRIIDLSKRAAQDISMTGAGVVPVSVSVLGK